MNTCALGLALALVSPVQGAWRLIWSDEFNGPPNATPDPSKWTYDLGNNNGWGNHERETYTNLPENAHMDGQGNLVIHVEKTPFGYTSARLKTQGLFAAQYGRVEARIKLPSGQGIWPTFWMLGSDVATVGWPRCGEIDIMENIGSQPSTNHGSMHGPGYSHESALTAAYTLPGGRRFSDDFHTFSIEWSRRAVRFYVDGVSYETVALESIPQTAQWVFDNPFFLLLNVAVGGNFPGPPDSTTLFPQDMLIDYVRVYQERRSLLNGVFDSASFSAVVAPEELATIFGYELASSTSGALYDASAGAPARKITPAENLAHVSPVFLPGGRRFLYSRTGSDEGCRSLCRGGAPGPRRPRMTDTRTPPYSE